jgi:UDP-N-acetylglucosamine transferase subunit ALG13
MIFVTVGAQMPFDRLVGAVDAWAGGVGRRDVFAQIGVTEYQPQYIDHVQLISPAEVRRRMREADVIIAHAGMGSILTALELAKPILVMPRRGDLKETRNDHQVATAKALQAHGRVSVAMDEAELRDMLRHLASVRRPQQIGPHAPARLTNVLREFIATGAPPSFLPSPVDALLLPGLAMSE